MENAILGMGKGMNQCSVLEKYKCPTIGMIRQRCGRGRENEGDVIVSWRVSINHG
jgi:hypothetical protein